MFSIVIPVFNEEDNLVKLIKEIRSSLKNYKKYELIFVNDFSTDKTIDILKQEKKNFKFKIINNKINLGQSHSILTGIKNLNDGCKDTGCSLKVFDKNIFLNFEYFDGIHRFIPALFKGFGYKTYFLNVDHRERKFGSSKYGTFFRLVNGLRDMIKVKKMIRKKKIFKL